MTITIILLVAKVTEVSFHHNENRSDVVMTMIVATNQMMTKAMGMTMTMTPCLVTGRSNGQVDPQMEDVDKETQTRSESGRPLSGEQPVRCLGGSLCPP